VCFVLDSSLRSIRSSAVVSTALWLLISAGSTALPAASSFVRGDSNADQSIDVSDPVNTLGWLFLGGAELPCKDAADANNDERLDLSDAVFELAYLFLGGPEPPAPFPTCGPDPEGAALDCASFEGCGGASAPNIRDVLGNCGGVPSELPPNSLQAGPDLHKVTLDFPEAVCNDGSPGVFYVRPAAPGSPDDRWIFYLQGGGGCSSYEGCLERWCSLRTSYDASKMSSAFTPLTIAGNGIFLRTGSPEAPENRFEDANQVYLYYCSSDSWTGQASDSVLVNPDDPAMRYSLHFRGHTIIEAVLAALRDGGLTSDDGDVTMPALADATSVLFTGFSAGSGGVQRNGDWFAAKFDPERTRVALVLSASFHPRWELHPDPARAAELSAAEEQRNRVAWAMSYSPRVWNAFVDESCLAYYTGTGEEWRCGNLAFVAHNFITTPFFARMDLFDENLRRNLAESIGSSDEDFLLAMRETMLVLPGMRAGAIEGASMPRAPGSLGPLCGAHVSLTNNNPFFHVTTEDERGVPRTYHDSLAAWLGGQDVLVVDDPAAPTSVCGERQEEDE